MSYEGVAFDFDGSLALARDLWDLAERVHGQRVALFEAGEVALDAWLGPYAVQFVGLRAQEDDDLIAVVAALQAEAIAWGQCWAAAMNEVNQRRHARAVSAERAVHHPFGEPILIPLPTTLSAPLPPWFAPTGDLHQF